MNRGMLLLGDDLVLQSRARRHSLPVQVGMLGKLPFGKTLIVEPGTRVPWDLLPAAWHFLDRWDAAVPLWRYGVTAADVGTPSERKITQAITRDLRVLLHMVELLFVRNNKVGRALIEAYRSELEHGDEKRLAFLRAFHRVKPRMCILPISWLADVQERNKQDAHARQGLAANFVGRRLVKVEIGPGQFVQCFAGDEDKMRAMMPPIGKRGRHEETG